MVNIHKAVLSKCSGRWGAVTGVILLHSPKHPASWPDWSREFWDRFICRGESESGWPFTKELITTVPCWTVCSGSRQPYMSGSPSLNSSPSATHIHTKEEAHYQKQLQRQLHMHVCVYLDAQRFLYPHLDLWEPTTAGLWRFMMTKTASHSSPSFQTSLASLVTHHKCRWCEKIYFHYVLILGHKNGHIGACLNNNFHVWGELFDTQSSCSQSAL